MEKRNKKKQQNINNTTSFTNVQFESGSPGTEGQRASQCGQCVCDMKLVPFTMLCHLVYTYQNTSLK